MLSMEWSRFCSTPGGSAGGNCMGGICSPLQQSASASSCQEALHLAPCSLQALITGAQIIFLASYLFLCVMRFNALWRQRFGIRDLLRTRQTPSIFRPVVACLALCVGTASFGVGGWQLLSSWGASAEPTYQGVGLLVKGLAWIVLSLTLGISAPPSMVTFLEIWWVATFLLEGTAAITAALDILVYAQNLCAEYVVDFATWSVSFLLLICLCKREKMDTVRESYTEPLLNGNRFKQDSDAADPLLAEDGLWADRHGEDYIVTPFERAGVFSRLSFLWLSPLMSLGYSRPLEQTDLPQLGTSDKALTAYNLFRAAWQRQQVETPSKAPSLVQVFAMCHWRDLAKNGVFALLKSLTLSASPVILNLFIGFVGGRKAFEYEGHFLVLGLFLAKITESLSQRQWYFGSRRVGLHLRSSLIAALYHKELVLSNSGRQRHAAGEVVSYMAVDAYRIGEIPFWFHLLWTTPLQIVIALIILFSTVGMGTLAGLAILLGVMILNSPLAKAQQRYQTSLMDAQDARLRATTEALRNIRILKLQAWEVKFKEKIESLRHEEWKWLSAVQFKKAYNSMLFWVSPIFMATATFVTAALLGTPLTASRVFTALATLRIIQEPIRLIPELLAVLIQFRVSTGRVAKFLEEKELDLGAVERVARNSTSYAVEIHNGVFSWESNSETTVLKDITVQIRHGDRVAVVGEVGAGKSSLLCAIIGETPKLSGVVKVAGSTAYVPQTPWIQSGTVQDNILFGLPMDESRYNACIKACALDKDIQGFAYGDQTEIGERGINMSGGQKQRIQLARAVYQDADIYLLDDPFSAVDAHTASSLFTDCVMGILAQKTVVLVTHQVEFLPALDMILLVDDGEIRKKGGFDELLESSSVFGDLVNAHQQTMGLASGNGEPDDAIDTSTVAVPISKIEHSERRQGSKLKTSRNPGVVDGHQLTKKEERKFGSPGLTTYRDYLWQNGGYLFCLGCVGSQLMFVAGQIASNWWMASETGNPEISVKNLVGVYAGFGLLSGFFVLMRSLFIVWMGLASSSSFFSGIMDSVFRSPMAFFDSTPTGRILSRVSSDMSLMDLDVPFNLGFSIGATLNAWSSLLVTVAVTWQVVILIFPVLCFNGWLQRYYLASAREIMRMNGTTKAPLVNHFGEASAGAVTIRAFRVEERFKKKNLKLIDDNASAVFHSFTANEWLIQRLEFMSSLVLTASALLIVLLPAGQIDPGFVGLALTYGLTLNVSMVYSVQNQCTLDNNIISVERIKQFMSLPSEAPRVIESNRPPVQWPSKGKVELQNLQIRYQPHSPLVLRGVSCTFQGGQRVGVVGRTGSGKTTLVSVLFRLVEPAGGNVVIDDIDITTIGLYDLRSRLSIIPQEPTMFRGTVRFNMDPVGQHPDHLIWEALDKCQLGDVIRERPHGLDSPVGDDGENWSAGQRQLFCLGRVLLKHSRILVLDEATASIDNATDSLLQKTIRQEFSECTVITVAHRIPTVVDSDMVLALHDGEIAEFDQPFKLLEDSTSLFAKLVAEYWSHAQHVSESGHDQD